MAGRETRENKLIALMINDLGPGFGEKEMVGLQGDVRSLSDEELRTTLITRLGLPASVEDGALEDALLHVEEPEEISGGEFTGAPDMSHDPRPEEREG